MGRGSGGVRSAQESGVKPLLQEKGGGEVEGERVAKRERLVRLYGGGG